MNTTRRTFVRGSVAGVGLMAAGQNLVAAPRQAVEAAMAAIVQSRPVDDTRVVLEIPPLVENGNLVVMKVSVQSPMTATDHIQAIHVIAEGNPLPQVISAYFTPRSGRAVFSARIRLAESQRVWAIAQASDGRLFRGGASSVVTLSACTEGL